jgi:hypothetical protein
MSLFDYHRFHAEPIKPLPAPKCKASKIPQHDSNKDLKKAFLARAQQLAAR